MIRNRTYEIARADISERERGLISAVERAVEAPALRWFVSRVTASAVTVETTEYVGELPSCDFASRTPPTNTDDVVVNIVPTGIGCEIGGYAGDAAPATALLAASAGLVVTNPNAVNASNFIHADSRVLYVEGSFIDLFSRGVVNLYRPRANRIGVIVERAPEAALETVFNILNVVRAVHGVDIVDYVVTDRPIGARCVRNASGAYVGSVDDVEVLIAAARQLVDRGASALAITTNVQDLPRDDYASHFLGHHPNPVGGAEAVMSHLLGKLFRIPVAHAPMINFKPGNAVGVVDARGAGEIASSTGLACVLIGLRRAPHIVDQPSYRLVDAIGVERVVAVVAPATALGGVPVLHAVERGTPVIAVRENGTCLNVSKDALGLKGVIEVDSYLEAAGVVLALREGIALASLRRPLHTLGR